MLALILSHYIFTWGFTLAESLWLLPLFETRIKFSSSFFLPLHPQNPLVVSPVFLKLYTDNRPKVCCIWSLGKPCAKVPPLEYLYILLTIKRWPCLCKENRKNTYLGDSHRNPQALQIDTFQNTLKVITGTNEVYSFPLEIMFKRSNFCTASTRILYTLCNRSPLEYHGPVQRAFALNIYTEYSMVAGEKYKVPPTTKQNVKNNGMAGRSWFHYWVEVGLNQPVFTNVDLQRKGIRITWVIS